MLRRYILPLLALVLLVKQYAVATQMLEKEYNKAKTRVEKGKLALLIGESYKELNQSEQSIRWYKIAYDNQAGLDALREYAFALKRAEQYKEAMQAFKDLGMNIDGKSMRLKLHKVGKGLKRRNTALRYRNLIRNTPITRRFCIKIINWYLPPIGAIAPAMKPIIGQAINFLIYLWLIYNRIIRLFLVNRSILGIMKARLSSIGITLKCTLRVAMAEKKIPRIIAKS